MRLDLFPAATWDHTNRSAKEEMRASVGAHDFEVRCYRGLVASLLETLSGTASFLSHKRTLGVLNGQSWAEEAVMPHLLRENFQVQYFSVADLANPEVMIERLGSDASCFLWPEDHPVTAERFESQALEEALNKKRIFSIRLSHHSYRTRAVAPGPYSVRLCSVAGDLAVAILGARFKTPPWTAPLEKWDTASVIEKIKTAFVGAQEDEAAVRKFEGGLGAGWQPLVTSSSRIWDRACIAHTEKSADRVLHDLERLLGKAMAPPGERSWIESLHLCRWESTMLSLDWWKNGPSPDLIRGSIFLDAGLLGHPEVEAYFKG